MHGTEFAWRAHTVQEQWAARVDAKAAVVFTVEGAIVAGALTALNNTALSTSITGWRLLAAWLGTPLSAAAVLVAFMVIFPQLEAMRTNQERHMIYFGHLHRWDAASLAERISTLSTDEQIHQLATQLSRLGRANWRKYMLLRTAIFMALPGTTLLMVALAWPQ